MIRDEILAVLQASEGKIVSGEMLAKQFSISRTAVRKHILALSKEYQIQSVPNKGYLLSPTDVFNAHEIQRFLHTKVIAKPIYFFDSIDSTNNKAKELAAQGAKNGTLVAAAAQTAGKGRKGRSFSSDPGLGVYLTVILRPKISLSEMNSFTLLAAVAIAETIEALTGVRAGIKWVNDVYLNGKKTSGILTEGSVEGESGMVDYLIVGMGVNLYHQTEDFPKEIQNTATSLLLETGKKISRARFSAKLMETLEAFLIDGNFPENKDEILNRYRKRLLFLGEEIQVITLTHQYPAVALDIDKDGCLLVKDEEGILHTLNTGEISIRKKTPQQ